MNVIRVSSLGIIFFFLTLFTISSYAEQTLTLTSSAFEHKGELPKKYSCNGDDISPPLTISGAPEGTQSFVLIMDDPDAPDGTWIHWVVYNLPGTTTEIPENAPTQHTWDDGTMQGRNSWSEAKYGGACPPDGQHRYFFKLYALDTVLDLKKKRSLRKVKKAMKKHIIAETKLMAKYG
ncbi:MAG: YbhB/YbcL family Raf kinase inhibitor-like protein [Cellvibrionaceae bacterium]